MAFRSLAFETRLILNKLRCADRIANAQTANEGDREQDDKEKEQARAALELRDRIAR